MSLLVHMQISSLIMPEEKKIISLVRFWKLAYYLLLSIVSKLNSNPHSQDKIQANYKVTGWRIASYLFLLLKSLDYTWLEMPEKASESVA